MIGCGMPDVDDDAASALALDVLLRDVDRMMRRRLDQHARRAGTTRSQLSLLLQLAAMDGCSQSALATALDCPPMALTGILDRLEAAGLVERRPDARDRRVWRLHLTARGADVLAGMRRHAAICEREAVADLSVEEIAVFRRLLATAKANLLAAMAGCSD